MSPMKKNGTSNYENPLALPSVFSKAPQEPSFVDLADGPGEFATESEEVQLVSKT